MCLAARFARSRHCAATFSLQVPNSCTDLDAILLYILIWKTYSKFVQENKMLALGVCFPQTSPSAGRKFAASTSRLNYYWQFVCFHNNEFDEKRCKLDPTEYARSFGSKFNLALSAKRGFKKPRRAGFFFAAPAANFWKRDIGSALERAFPGGFGHVSGYWTPPKKDVLVHKNSLFSKLYYCMGSDRQNMEKILSDFKWSGHRLAHIIVTMPEFKEVVRWNGVKTEKNRDMYSNCDSYVAGDDVRCSL